LEPKLKKTGKRSSFPGARKLKAAQALHFAVEFNPACKTDSRQLRQDNVAIFNLHPVRKASTRLEQV